MRKKKSEWKKRAAQFTVQTAAEVTITTRRRLSRGTVLQSTGAKEREHARITYPSLSLSLKVSQLFFSFLSLFLLWTS